MMTTTARATLQETTQLLGSRYNSLTQQDNNHEDVSIQRHVTRMHRSTFSPSVGFVSSRHASNTLPHQWQQQQQPLRQQSNTFSLMFLSR